jgi:hypothetical protein
MVMATRGTFDYRSVATDGSHGTRQMQGMLREPIEGDQDRLLGHAPLLQTVEYQGEKRQLPCRVTLTATDKQHAMASSFSFNVDRELIAMLRAKDVQYISCTPLCRAGPVGPPRRRAGCSRRRCHVCSAWTHSECPVSS